MGKIHEEFIHRKGNPKLKKKKTLKLTSGQRNAYSNDIKLISTKMAKLEK